MAPLNAFRHKEHFFCLYTFIVKDGLRNSLSCYANWTNLALMLPRNEINFSIVLKLLKMFNTLLFFN